VFNSRLEFVRVCASVTFSQSIEKRDFCAKIRLRLFGRGRHIRLSFTKLLLGKVALLMLSGLAIGWTLTLALRKVLSAVVEMHAEHDFPLLASVTAGLAFVGILASLIPARRAASVEPVQALRTE
jgi:ABC-type antimicrobial peptide transport system permease subunit